MGYNWVNLLNPGLQKGNTFFGGYPHGLFPPAIFKCRCVRYVGVSFNAKSKISREDVDNQISLQQRGKPLKPPIHFGTCIEIGSV
jgi:hypothetical protein